MPIYRQKEPIEFPVGTGETVELTVDCYHGTLSNVRSNRIDFACGECKAIGGAELKGKTKNVTGTPRNPEEGPIKVKHTFKTSSTEKCYTFPDDYDGDDAYDPNDPEVTYFFEIKYV